MRRGWGLVTIASAAIAIALGAGFALPAHAEAHRPARPQEAICRMVDAAAENNRLPTAFLTRVLWQESGFRTDVTSPAGAAGVAQFMPETAAKRGLADPYDPGPAIIQAARLLDEFLARAVRLQQQPSGTVPISSRNRSAETLCNRIRATGSPCTVYDR